MVSFQPRLQLRQSEKSSRARVSVLPPPGAGVDGAHCAPVQLNTCPLDGVVEAIARPCNLLTVADPNVPFNLGCEPGATVPTVTPFNGEQNAGIQVVNTAQFPVNAGPLSHVHR